MAAPHLTEEEREYLGMMSHLIAMTVGTCSADHWDTLSDEDRAFYRKTAIKGLNVFRNTQPLILDVKECKRRVVQLDKKIVDATPDEVLRDFAVSEQIRIYQRAEERMPL